VNFSRRALLAAPFLAAGAPAQSLFVDDAGRPVALPARVERIFAAGPPAAILLFALAPEKLAGWTAPLPQEARAFLDARWAGLPVTGRLTGRGNSANLEEVLKAAPDLVLDYGSVTDTYVSLADRVQDQARIPVLLLDGRFDLVARSVRRLGAAIGAAETGERLAADAEARLAAVDRVVGTIPEAERVRVYYARGPDGLSTGLGGSINVETLGQAGGRNVAEAAGQGGLAQVSLEQVLAWDPQVIVTTDARFFDRIRTDPLWAGVRARREGRVHLSPLLPFGWIDFPPSTNRLIGVEWLARLLYPQLFAEDFAPSIKSFYALHYHRAPDAQQLAAMLKSLERMA
jgi:iron complex transport system substrate-binding protein